MGEVLWDGEFMDFKVMGVVDLKMAWQANVKKVILPKNNQKIAQTAADILVEQLRENVVQGVKLEVVGVDNILEVVDVVYPGQMNDEDGVPKISPSKTPIPVVDSTSARGQALEPP